MLSEVVTDVIAVILISASKLLKLNLYATKLLTKPLSYSMLLEVVTDDIAAILILKYSLPHANKNLQHPLQILISSFGLKKPV